MTRITWLATALALATLPLPAAAELGLRLGGGAGLFVDAEGRAYEPDVLPLTAGVAWRLTLPPLVQLEVDGLYALTRSTVDEITTTEHSLAVPAIARLWVPVVPELLALGLGVGIDVRLLLSHGTDAPADRVVVEPDYARVVAYLPVSFTIDATLAGLGLSAELRYLHQLGPQHDSQGDDRVHHLLGLLGVFF